jgi:hypothetical protein
VPRRRGLPVVAILDTDCDPDLVDIPVPGNDDAMRSVRLLLDRLGSAVEEGSKAWGLVVAEREKAEADRRRRDDAVRQEQRQRDAVTEDWQRRLREEAEKRRQGIDVVTPTSGPDAEPPPSKGGERPRESSGEERDEKGRERGEEENPS